MRSHPETKRKYIFDLILERNLDVLFITESWLYEKGDEATIAAMTPPGYSSKSLPRNNDYRGGGIISIFKSSMASIISFPESNSIKLKSFELLEMKIKLKTNDVNIKCIYRPPSGDTNPTPAPLVREELDKLFSTIHFSKGFPIIFGDFNFHFDQDTSQVTKIKEILAHHSLLQLVDKPTHRGGHILDWVVVRDTDPNYVETSVKSAPVSDHSVVLINVKVVKDKNKEKTTTSRNLKAVNIP